jgi:hypothetical protein
MPADEGGERLKDEAEAAAELSSQAAEAQQR